MRKFFTLRLRVAFITLLGLFFALTIMVVLSYLSRAEDRTALLPQPAQLAAIVKILEQTSDQNQEVLYDALRSIHMSLRVLTDASVEIDLEPLWSDQDDNFLVYEDALNGHEFAIYQVPRKFFRNGFLTPLRAIEFRIALKSGGVLVISSESVVMLTPGGLPAGFAAPIIGLVIAVIALLLLNREFKPLLRLAKAVEVFDPSDKSAKLPDINARSEEVKTLLVAFEKLCERIATLIHARTALVGGIQHDVRTLATRLRLRVEKISDDDERFRAEADITDLISLIDNALLASRSDAGELQLELLDFKQVIEAEVKDCKSQSKLVEFSYEPNLYEAMVLADRLALRRILSNLMENALRYGQSAKLHLLQKSGEVVLFIDDDGPGIPIDQRKLLLEPFTRLEDSRARHTGGAGLGLAIVHNLASEHGGSITIDDAPSGGARLIVTLPVYE